MDAEKRRSELDEIFADIDEGTRKIIAPMIDEVVAMELRMKQLRGLPFIRVHPRRPELQKYTPAAKLYKETASSYMNAIRILCGIVAKHEPSAQDELMKRLEEFDLGR